MSYKHDVTFKCDACDTNYLINEDSMELPPGWLGMQIVIADLNGYVPDHEREVYCHFCSQNCLIEYSSSNEMRERLLLAGKEQIDEGTEEES